jgi:putative ABC transport system permease protein
MLRNYLKIALKVLGRRKFFTLISLFGISFTLMVLLVVTALIDNALAPGAPEVHLARTLHISRMDMRGDRVVFQGAPGYAFLDRYVRDIPGVELTSIFSNPSEVISFVEGEKVDLRMRRTDGTYWEILDFDFVEGGAFTEEDNLAANHVTVISRATRQRFFGGEPALGRYIECDGQRLLVVGVVANVPITRVTACADLWTPTGTTKTRESLEQLMGDHEALLLAESRAEFPRIKAEFQSRLKHVEFPDPERFHTFRGAPLTRFETLVAEGGSANEHGEPRVAVVLSLIFAAVMAFLLLPTVNLISINMSRILERALEIGVRKAFGASSAHLIGQFIVENMLLCLVGGVIALIGAAAVLAWVNASGVIPNADFRLNYRIFGHALLLSGFFGVLSGIYPAWRMSRLHPVLALGGGTR